MRGRLVPIKTVVGFAAVLGFVGFATRGTHLSTAVAHAVADPDAREGGAAKDRAPAIETPDSPTPVRRAVVSNEPGTTPIPNCLVVIVRNEDGSLATGVGVRIENTKERTRSATLIAAGYDPRAVFSKRDLALVLRSTGEDDPLDIVVRDREITRKSSDLSTAEALGRVIEVVLAPIGTIEVEVCANGERLRETTRVRLHRARPVATSTARIDAMASDELYTSNGLAIFRGVDCRGEVSATAEFDGVEFESRVPEDVSVSSLGPRKLRIDVVPNPHLSFCAVDAAGKPFGFVNIDALFQSGRERAKRTITTDTAGHARVSIPRFESAATDCWLTLEREQGGQRYRGRFAIGSYLDRRDHDLRNLVLDVLEPIVQGRVVGPHGEPIANASVTLTRSSIPISALPSLADSEVTRTEMDGSFLLYGFLGDEKIAEDYVVLARHPAYVGGAPAHLRGANRDLRIVLEAGGAIRGSLALVKDHPVRVSLRLSRDLANGDPSGLDALRVEEIEDPDEFVVSALRPGSWRLEVLLGGLVTDAVVDDLVVLPGEVTNDPRLARLPVRLSGRAIQIAVVDAETRERLTSKVVALDDEAAVDIHAESVFDLDDCDTHDVWLKDESAGRFLVTADDHRSAVIEHVRASTTVELAPEPGLVLRVHGAEALASATSRRIRVGVVAASPKSGADSPDSNGPRSDTNVEFSGFVDHGFIQLEAIPAPGRYQVHWVHGGLSPASNDELVTDLTIPEHATAITLDVEAPKPAAR